jgi:tRNA A37 threonylcarbamoyladenosine dehydratase/nitroreductase
MGGDVPGELRARIAQPDVPEPWRAESYRLEVPEERAALARLLASDAVRFVHDTAADQLAELVASRSPERKLAPDEIARGVDELLAGRPLEELGAWIHYPWSARLVHCLPPAMHREIRTDRNRYKITAAEQARLAGAKIGIIGLSVGNMAAITFALEGIGSHFRLADFDRLSLSNLNRLRGGVHELGFKKTTLAAREMFEIDPYLEIELFDDGVNDDNVDRFLDGPGGRLDLLIEECDDLYLKVAVRLRARELGIPVIMDTSDRGLLDVERFDTEPTRPIFHGLIGDTAPESLRRLASKDKVPFFLAIVDPDRMSARMAASLPEIDQTISTWPQLASGVALGGAITADAARRVLLGSFKESGRYYVDPESIVRDGAGMYREPVAPPAPRSIAPEALREPELPPKPTATGEVSPEAVRWIAGCALLAPSAHNTQPWRLRWHAAERRLECRHDPSHDLPALDFEAAATHVAFGALAENVSLAARAIGLAATIRPLPGEDDPQHVCSIDLAPSGGEAPDDLVDWIPHRATNRRRDPVQPIAAGDAQSLAAAAASREAELHLVSEPAAIAELSEILGACDRITLLNRPLHEDFFSGFRWDRAHVEATRDGLDLDVLELTEPERAGLGVLRQWRVMDTIGRVGGGRALEDLARTSVIASAAIGLMTAPGTGPQSYFQGGRAVQRLWLTATRQRLALHPWTGLPFLLARLERGGGRGFSDAERAELSELRRRFASFFPTSPACAEVFLFRLSPASRPPTARSLRRPLDAMFEVI